MKSIPCITFILLLFVGSLQAQEEHPLAWAFVELKGSQASKQSIDFSPDGKKVLTACADRVVRIWNPETGEKMQEFAGHAARTAVFSKDGKKVLTHGMDNVRIWDVESGKELHTLAEDENPASYSAAFSPDGKKVATVGSAIIGNGDDFVRIWDAETGKVLHRLERTKFRVWIVSFSPDSKKIITTDEEKTLRIWNVDTGEKLFDLEKHASWVFAAVFSPDGKKILSTSQDTTARIWDAETGKELQRLYDHGNGLWYCSENSFSPDSKKVVTTNFGEGGVRVWDPLREREIQKNPGHTCRIWDVESGKVLQKLEGHTMAVQHAAFLPDGKKVITRGADHTVRIWDAESGKELQVVKIDRAMNSFPPPFSSDGKRIATLDGISARIWNLEALLAPPPPAIMDF
jgi:WD40 repeat protein